MKLATFFLIALFVHGPLSPLLPTAFESALFSYAHLYPAWVLALVGTVGATLSEYVNYRLVDLAAELPRVAALREKKAVRWSIDAFKRAPFWATVLVIFSPIPDSAVRVLAPLSKYPLPKFLLAIALGRLPRVFLFASLGRLLPVPPWALALCAALAIGFTVLRPKIGALFRSRPSHSGVTACLVAALALLHARSGRAQEPRLVIARMGEP